MNRQEARSRAEELVSRMSLAEVMSQLRYNSPALDRLGVPAYNWWGEALHGVARAGCATSFPQAVGMAAAFDADLIREAASVIAEEGRAKYNAYSGYGDRDIYKGLTFWSPNINIFRDPRWGRGQETYGEDPYLSGTLGCAFVEGLQGNDEYMKAAACAKHFAVHSGPEALRHSFDAQANPKDLWETYLPAFEMLVQNAKVEAVMGAYNRVNGFPSCAQPELMGKILRGKWGFEGHFVSDCWAINDFHENHKVTNTAAESAAMAMNAGCDLNCGSAYLSLNDAFEQGLVSEDRLREAAVRLFTTRYLLGLFDETEFDEIPYTVVECPEHLDVACRMSEEGIVLLKNNGILPLDRTKIRTIGVIGPNADSRAALIGNYHGTSSEYITVLEGIRKIAGEGIRILYSEGCSLNDDRIEHLAMANDRISEALIVADNSDLVVVAVGLNETLEGEEGDTGNSYASGDKMDLLLPGPQRELLKALENSQKPVILCLMTGSAIDLSEADEHFDAVLQLWYPGARGGEAAAKILFGEVSPSGKLCVTFYHNDDPLPPFTDYSMKGRTYRYLEQDPLYPFGYGLSYGDVRVVGAEISGDPHVIKAICKNESSVGTREVLQVYVDAKESQHKPLHPRLCGFASIYMEGNSEQEAEIRLDPHTFEVINEEGMRVSGGREFDLYIGTSQPDPRSIALTGKTPVKLTLSLEG